MTDAPEVIADSDARFYKTFPSIGAVQIRFLDDGKAIIVNSALAEQPTVDWIIEQLTTAGFLDYSDVPPDNGGIEDLRDEYLVPDERTPVTYGLVRGTYEGRPDMLGVLIVADVHPLDHEDEYYRIATFPLGAWAEREEIFLEGLRALAMQRYAREQLLASVAREMGHEPVPVPGLRLKKPIHVDPGGQFAYQAEWDLTSERGGLG